MAQQPGVVIVGGGLSLMNYLEQAVKTTSSITVVMGSGFLEWPMGAAYFLAKPEAHDEFLCVRPEKYQKPGVTYLVEVAKEVDPDRKVLICASGRSIPYRALIVSTGFKIPLLYPTPGQTLAERKEEVQRAGRAIREARKVVVSGGGSVGLEVAGDIRVQYPDKEVVILTRDGRVLGSSHPAKLQRRAADKLKSMRIDVVKGSVDAMNPILERGSLDVKDGDSSSIDFDVFLPAFQQGPNTDFLQRIPNMLNARKQIQVNEFLQSKAHPEIFTIGQGDVDESFVGALKLTAMASSVATNVAAFLAGRAMKAHKDTAASMTRPLTIKIGHGPGGYMWWDTEVMPLPAKCCSCCGLAGFPFCPPPCCWCCCKGSCACCCGNCGGECGGEAASRFYFHALMKMFPGKNGYAGMGEPPVQQTM
mmetsp:Transcript_110429/g.356442  ORF Transcript_110429/g.356442 Transcript_110429/m.356442 type:complete len:419 (+) Transcript_110429:1-1257(+)